MKRFSFRLGRIEVVTGHFDLLTDQHDTDVRTIYLGDGTRELRRYSPIHLFRAWRVKQEPARSKEERLALSGAESCTACGRWVSSEEMFSAEYGRDDTIDNDYDNVLSRWPGTAFYCRDCLVAGIWLDLP